MKIGQVFEKIRSGKFLWSFLPLFWHLFYTSKANLPEPKILLEASGRLEANIVLRHGPSGTMTPMLTHRLIVECFCHFSQQKNGVTDLRLRKGDHHLCWLSHSYYPARAKLCWEAPYPGFAIRATLISGLTQTWYFTSKFQWAACTQIE